MNRLLVLSMGTVLLLGSCGSYAGSGAYAGATFGSILGSAIGGLSDGPRGHDIGTIVGMAGGAVIGAAIGGAADQKRQQDMDQYRRDKALRESGDDRINFEPSQPAHPQAADVPSARVESLTQGMAYTPAIEIRNARFLDSDGDGAISRGELCRVVFEVMNSGQETLYDVQPMVIETTGCRHLFISPSLHVERIAPDRGIRYTAMVKADRKLRDGEVRLALSVVQGQNERISRVSEFNVATVGR